MGAPSLRGALAARRLADGFADHAEDAEPQSKARADADNRPQRIDDHGRIRKKRVHVQRKAHS